MEVFYEQFEFFGGYCWIISSLVSFDTFCQVFSVLAVELAAVEVVDKAFELVHGVLLVYGEHVAGVACRVADG